MRTALGYVLLAMLSRRHAFGNDLTLFLSGAGRDFLSISYNTCRLKSPRGCKCWSDIPKAAATVHV